MDTEDIGRAVQVLLDTEAIRVLKARYFRYLDLQQWEEWRPLFTEDLEFESEFTHTRLSDRDSFVSRFIEARSGGRSVHHGHMGEIEVTGPDSATGIWAFEDYVEEAPSDGRRPAFRGSGHYRERYVKRDGRWLIAAITLSRLRVDTLDTLSSHLG